MSIILIVSKTHMKNGVCVGAINEDNCELIRVHNENGGNLTKDAAYEIGDRWDVLVKKAWNARPVPHVEDKQTTPNHIISNIGVCGIINFILHHNFDEKLTRGPIQDTFQGYLKLEGNNNYINRENIPDFSTQFWLADDDLRYERNNEKDYYYYKTIRIRFVGFQDIVDIIPQGTIIRLSLANWWDRDGSGEYRCYLQLSGWYYDTKSTPNETNSNL